VRSALSCYAAPLLSAVCPSSVGPVHGLLHPQSMGTWLLFNYAEQGNVRSDTMQSPERNSGAGSDGHQRDGTERNGGPDAQGRGNNGSETKTKWGVLKQEGRTGKVGPRTQNNGARRRGKNQLLGFAYLPYPLRPTGFSPGVKWPELEADHLYPFCVQVRMRVSPLLGK
jgi:hypothetical protein